MKAKILLPLALLATAFIRFPAQSASISSYNAITAPKTQKAYILPSNTETSLKTQLNGKNSVEYIKSYILSQAKAENVSTTIVAWIVQRESQWGQRMFGDDGNSRGIWMISRIWHPEVSQQCAMDLKCSTQFALNLIKKGGQNQWSSWRLRCVWYKNDNPPDC